MKKSIVGIVNKLNNSNIEHVVIELFNENLDKGRGLLVNSIIKGQMASPSHTQVYSALINIINSKIPEIGGLLIRRLLLQFRRSFRKNDRLSCHSTVKFFACLIQFKMLSDIFGL